MILLGVDVGTTHCKAGLFRSDGTAVRIASRPMRRHTAPEGYACFDPEELWETAAGAIREVIADQTESVAVVGIASMAETGLLVDRQRGEARSWVIPWFDMAAQPQADAVAQQIDTRTLFLSAGLRINYKCSLVKLLWLKASDPEVMRGVVWLGAADYIAYRLTGAFGTDYSLAGRTCAFDVGRKQWNADWLRMFGLPADIFPPALPSGTPAGITQDCGALGLPDGIPVAVSGHDHVCAALAVGTAAPGAVFDSMGTAEALMGVYPERPLTDADFDSGLMVGCHVVQGCHYWMGGVSASGGAVEWLRSLFNSAPLSYDELLDLLQSASPNPTGILFFPYLLGSGTPHADPLARGAWFGLRAMHQRADMAKSVLEGTAYQMEFIRRTGEQMTGEAIQTFTVAGGGSRNRIWLQIKADVSGCPIMVSPEPEATLLGAALVAAVGSGVYASPAEALAALAPRSREVIQPDEARHQIYRSLFEQGYLGLQEPVRKFSRIYTLDGISG